MDAIDKFVIISLVFMGIIFSASSYLIYFLLKKRLNSKIQSLLLSVVISLIIVFCSRYLIRFVTTFL